MELRSEADVDHDLDLALEMAHLEWRLGFQSTYFILPNTHYWKTDEHLIAKCLQFQDYGHEVGLHVNCVAEWLTDDIDDISISLKKNLDFMRSNGLNERCGSAWDKAIAQC